MKKEADGIFFLCSGFGLGNSSRISAIIDELIKTIPENKIHIFTWGPAVSFFRQHPKYKDVKIVKLQPYSLSQKFLKMNYIVTMLMTVLASPFKYLENSLIIFRYTIKLRPHLIVFDSDYHFFPFFLVKKPVMVSINQSYNALINFFYFSFHKKVETLPSFVIEVMDAMVQLIFVDRIFVPSIRKHKSYFFKKIIALPLIVREPFLTEKRDNDLKPIGVCLSGSGIECEKMMRWVGEKGADVIKVENNEFHKNIYPVPRIMNYEEIVCQGGLSTIGEVLATGRKIQVLPMTGHCEQHSNFYDVEKIEDKKKYSANQKNFEGSRVIASEIIEHLNSQV